MSGFIDLIPSALKALAKNCPSLYVVGGSTRDFLCGYAEKTSDFKDWDICAPLPAEVFGAVAAQNGFTIRSVFKNTGTVKLTDCDGIAYEFTSFRSDKYVRGEHRPSEVYFTQELSVDALRRDFTCNAIYYNVQAEKFFDPTDGIKDIKNRRMRTVREGNRVFGEDGLRLLRFARQCGQLAFVPEKESLLAAKANASLIRDIFPERIFAEMQLCLTADKKYGVKGGQYAALKILTEIGITEQIFPELAAGAGMSQHSDFHRYDVLEHSLRCVYYAPENIRWAALLHDVGKPYCKKRDGNFYAHPQEGAIIAESILTRLKAPKLLIRQTKDLILLHMYDLDGKTNEGKLRRFLVGNYAILPDLLALKQADFSACKDDTGICPTRIRWEKLLAEMKKEGTPFTTKELRVSGKELSDMGFPLGKISATLREFLLICATEPKENSRERLLRIAARRM